MSRTLRIAILLLILLFVALSAWQTRIRLASWEDPHWVAVYPVNAAGTPAVAHYIDNLRATDLQPIEDWFRKWSRQYDSSIGQPFEFRLAPPVSATPPATPPRGAILRTILWSLHLRYWAWRHDSFDGPADLQIFMAYHDPEETHRVAHSVGLRKGGVGVVNGFGGAGYTPRNNVVIAHELLHLVGASDKYDPESGRPVHPHGFAEPRRQPLFPQRRAEIMGATIPLGPHERVMPGSLAATVIGPATALEIGWISD